MADHCRQSGHSPHGVGRRHAHFHRPQLVAGSSATEAAKKPTSQKDTRLLREVYGQGQLNKFHIATKIRSQGGYYLE